MKLPKIETLIIIAFLGSVCLWAISKCSAKKAQLSKRSEMEAEDDRPAKRDTVFVPAQPSPTPTTTQVYSTPQPTTGQPANTTGRLPQLTPTPTATIPVPASTPSAAPTTTAAASGSKYSTLYVAIDGLKVRKEAGLKGDLVAKLELYEPVSFLNQKTEWTQEISLGTEKVTDHWVKIRTRSGKEGWVFGAGVHYYKMKRKGVLE